MVNYTKSAQAMPSFFAVDKLGLFSLSEFCDHLNTFLPITADHVVTTMTVEYELEPAPKLAETEEVEEKPDNSVVGAEAKGPKKCHPSKLIVYMVDVSGSMSATTEVPALQGVCLIKSI